MTSLFMSWASLYDVASPQLAKSEILQPRRVIALVQSFKYCRTVFTLRHNDVTHRELINQKG